MNEHVFEEQVLTSLLSSNFQTSTAVQASRIHFLPVRMQLAFLYPLASPVAERFAVFEIGARAFFDTSGIESCVDHWDGVAA